MASCPVEHWTVNTEGKACTRCSWSISKNIWAKYCHRNALISYDSCLLTLITPGYWPHSFLAKVDIKSAFRLIPVHPTDRYQLGMLWCQQVYIDKCLPFGLHSAVKLFNIMTDLVAWIATQHGVSSLLHYLDDFLLVGPPHSSNCQQDLDSFIQLCPSLGIPLVSKKIRKIEGPTTSLTFLGVLLQCIAQKFLLYIHCKHVYYFPTII